MKNRIAITLVLAALAVGVLASASIGQAASKAGSAQLSPGGTWQDVAPLPQTLFGPATVTDGTYVYAFGGYHFPENVGSTLDVVYRYTPSTDTWTTMTPMPQPSLIATAVYYPPTNKIYVFGGATRTPDPIIVYDTTLIYDIATNTWSSGATMPGPRYQMAGGYNSADGKIYLNGGYSASTIDTVSDATWKYDPAANSFTELAPSPIARGGPAFGIINGHFLVAGGRTNPDETLVATWDYNIASDTWTQKQDMPEPTNVPGSAVAAGQLWAMGGCTPTPCNPFPGLNAVESFDPGANTWSAAPSLNHARSFPGGAAIDNTLYAVGGRDGLDVSLDTVEKLV
ncbi:MAG TPA: kelch repeat-containing protein, partial [Gaiellaceae bacterium]|nr:kelch repeat-containing protein [Gaiellaceae bacterium]